MAFESLTDKLQNVFKKLRSKGVLTEEDVKARFEDGVLTLTYKVGKNIDVPKHYEVKGDKLIINEPVQESADKVIEKPYEYTRVK